MAEERATGRRAVLIGSVALVGGGLLALTLRWSGLALPGGGGSARDEMIAVQLKRLLGHSTPIRRLGRRYLARFPEEADRALLVSKLFGELPEATSVGSQGVAEYLRRMVEADFDRGEIERIGGWILSKSELRLCALASLL